MQIGRANMSFLPTVVLGTSTKSDRIDIAYIAKGACKYTPEDYRVEGEREYDVDACEYWGHPGSKYEFVIAWGDLAWQLVRGDLCRSICYFTHLYTGQEVCTLIAIPPCHNVLKNCGLGNDQVRYPTAIRTGASCGTEASSMTDRTYQPHQEHPYNFCRNPSFTAPISIPHISSI